jgi:diketogulonate reductase-like aldo/keto reductase
MLSKKLGDSGERISEIGIGTWQYAGGPRPLQRAIELGASLIDTAERYGTEGAVGEALYGLRSKVFLATKVRHENLRYADVLRAADNSLKQLRMDHIDLYQVHRPNPEVPIAETMAAMDELVDAGKVRYIGVSNFSVAQMEAAQAASRHPIVSNQVRYSLVDRTIEQDLLPYCQRKGITVIAYTPLARGVGNFQRGTSGNALREVAETEGRTEAQVALNWCIAHDNVVAIPRASTVEHVEDVCGASGWRLSSESMDRLDRAYAADATMRSSATA